MTPLLKDQLETFVADVDAHGGPSAPDFWQRFGSLRYKPSIAVDPKLDPFSDDYFDAMLAVYEEISGTTYNPVVTELTDFDIDLHADGPTSYGPHVAPAEIAMHFHRLSSAIRFADLPLGSSIMDMGCGWGFSSELLAQCGFSVTAVDINPKFVALVERRSRLRNYRITAVQSSFDDFEPEKNSDGVLFYECLHHAAKPWTLIETLADKLNEGGKFMLAGEPIQNEFWPHWGMRLDPLSIYCIRKFGWFESGWSLDFLRSMFARSGLAVRVKIDPDPVIGTVVCAERLSQSVSASSLVSYIDQSEWTFDGTNLISAGSGSIALTPPRSARTATLKISNFRGRPIALRIAAETRPVFDGELAPGENSIHIKIPGDTIKLDFVGEQWSPAEELGSADARMLSFHLTRVEFHRKFLDEKSGKQLNREALRMRRQYTLASAYRFLKRQLFSILKS